MPLLKLTRPSDLVWQISFDSAPDNRLTNDMFAELMDALDRVEYEWRSQSEFEGGFLSRVLFSLVIDSCWVRLCRMIRF
jgi:hypothetical protein